MGNVVSNLADAIIKSGKSITEISRKSNLSRPFLYKIIKKEVSTVSTDSIEAICKAIGCNIEEIVASNLTPKKNTIVFFGRGEGRKEFEVSDEEMEAWIRLIEATKNSKDNNDGNF